MHNDRCGDLALLTGVLVGLAVYLTVPAVLFVWARWLRRNTAAPLKVASAAFWLADANASMIALAPLVACVLGVFTAVTSGTPGEGPAHRSRFLATVIARAAGFGMIAWVATAAVTALLLLYATWRWHWSVRPAVPAAEPPYR